MLDLFVADDLWAAREEKTRNSKVEKSGVNSIILNDTGSMGGILCMREVGLAIWATSRRMGDMPFAGWFSFSVFPFICIGNGGFNASRGFRAWTRHKAGNGMGWDGHGCLLRR